MQNYPQQNASPPFMRAAFLLAMAFGGLILSGVVWPETTAQAPPLYRYVGWAMVLLPILRWRVIVGGLRQWGAILLFFAVVGLLASVFSGEGGLWSLFF